MRTYFLVILPLLSGLACRGVSVEPGPTPTPLPPPCITPTTFTATVRQGSTTPIVSLTNAYLIINGESIRMTPPGGSPWGIYMYTGSMPYDGEIRFRYLFRYTSGTGAGGSDHEVYGPSDRYLVRPVGDVTWSSPGPGAPLPDDQVQEPVFRRPRRFINMFSAFPTGFSGNGALTQTADLVIHNGATTSVTMGMPVIAERQTGSAVPGLTIAQASGSTTYPITIPGGAATRFRMTARATISNSQEVQWSAGVTIPTTIGVRTCQFGPVWVDVRFDDVQ